MRTLSLWMTCALVVVSAAACTGSSGDDELPASSQDIAGGPRVTGANGVGVASGTCTTTERNNATANGGVHYWTCQGNARYICDELGNKVVESCPSGCISEGLGVDDQCNGGGGVTCTNTEIIHQTGSGAFQPSFWTCEGVARYVCDGRGFRIKEACSGSCVPAGSNHDDQCSACTHCQ